MDINQINRYKGARSELLIYLVLTIVNTVVIAIGWELNFIYADFAVPVSYVIATLAFRGFGSFMIILTGIIAPILIMAAAYLLSGKSYKALLLAAVTVLFEALKLVVYTFLFYEGFPFALEVIVGIVVSVLLFVGYVTGRKFAKANNANITDYIG